MTDWPGIAVTVGLGLGGLYLGNSVRRRTRAEIQSDVAEKRLGAYADLWAKTKLASPMRGEPLTQAEREQLFEGLTDWYYDGGKGMLLSESTRTIYLAAKKNLTCPVGEIEPERLREQLSASERVDELRGQASMDQLSLLRTSMRADIEIYSGPYDGDLSDDDIAFLVACDVDLGKPPWKNAIARQRRRPDV